MTKNDPKINGSQINQNGQKGQKWTRKVVPMMGQKCTMKRPAYDAGARDKEKKKMKKWKGPSEPEYNSGTIDKVDNMDKQIFITGIWCRVKGKRKTPAYNAGIIYEGGQTSRYHAKQKTD